MEVAFRKYLPISLLTIRGENGVLGLIVSGLFSSDALALQIMDGIISLPICLAGFFLLPDLPENTRAFYLKEEVSLHLFISPWRNKLLMI